MSELIDQYKDLHPFCEITGQPLPYNIMPHHIKTRGSGGTDDHDNLIRLSPKMHRLIHRIGVLEFYKKYPHEKLRKYLNRRGLL